MSTRCCDDCGKPAREPQCDVSLAYCDECLRRDVPIIAHRYNCPSCGAVFGEPCRLGGKFPQEYSHVSRHKVADAALWAEMEEEIAAGTSPIASISWAR